MAVRTDTVSAGRKLWTEFRAHRISLGAMELALLRSPSGAPDLIQWSSNLRISGSVREGLLCAQIRASASSQSPGRTPSRALCILPRTWTAAIAIEFQMSLALRRRGLTAARSLNPSKRWSDRAGGRFKLRFRRCQRRSRRDLSEPEYGRWVASTPTAAGAMSLSNGPGQPQSARSSRARRSGGSARGRSQIHYVRLGDAASRSSGSLPPLGEPDQLDERMLKDLGAEVETLHTSRLSALHPLPIRPGILAACIESVQLRRTALEHASR